MVEKFVDIKPSYVRLIGVLGQPIATPVSIVPQKKHPFKITGVTAMKGDNIQFSLSEKELPEGNGYELMLTNKKTDPGRYHDVLSLKTDSSIQPVLKINVYGRITAPKPAPEKTDVKE